MSDSILVKINCFHSGVFIHDEDGMENYVDGFMEQFEVNGDACYEEVLKIIVQKVNVGRMWYKLPYEDILDKKELLENEDKNKKRMASNGRYYGELDVFIEKPETSVVIGDGVVVDTETEHEAELEDEEVDGLYLHGLKPVNGPRLWERSGEERIEAPPYKRPPRRPKGKARIKGVNESPKKNQTKVSRKGRQGHCGVCGCAGHNSRKCPNETEENRAKRRRLTAVEQEVADISSTAPPVTQT